MTKQEYLNKILNGEELSESELIDLVWDNDLVVDNVEGDCGSWTQSMQTIVKLDDRYFAVDWERGLTEMQENEFYNQPYEVKKVDKMVKVTEWVDKWAKDDKKGEDN